MNDWLISIGTGISQEPLILSAKKLGYKVAGVDQNPNELIVDHTIKISTYEYDLILKEISRLPFKNNINGVIARVSGPAILTAAKISGFLGLPTYTVEIAEMSVSKSCLRQVCEKEGIISVQGHHYEHLPKWIDEQDLVVKPDQPIVGKKNVFRVKNEKEFKKAFKLAAEESFNGFVECQKFEQGIDIGLVVATLNGKIIWNFLFEEIVDEKDGNFIGKGVRAPAKEIGEDIHKKIIESAEKVIGSLKPSGFIFFSYRLIEPNIFKLYEINPGLCGDNIVDVLFKKIWPDCNFYEFDVKLATNFLPNLPDTSNLIEAEHIVNNQIEY